MVKLNKIYTRTGDDGTTGLVAGERRPKYDLRIEAYGTVDETNAVIGMARLHTGLHADLDAMLMRIQNDCFDLGADLATPDTGEKLRIRTAAHRRRAGGPDRGRYRQAQRRSRAAALLHSAWRQRGAAYLHLARTVARRAERLIVELADQKDETVNSAAIRFVNRLSDFLFVAARWVNDRGRTDVLWVPGKNR
jgi:cob(I)alamin adenosyltransferase